MSLLTRLGVRRFDQRTASNVGKWDPWYARISEPELYGDETTYRIAADFLADCDLVEDWGCGKGGFRRFCRTRYVGVDGSKTPFADRIADLANYTTEAPGILLRHVLEHNMAWERVLDNAVASFGHKLCIVLFTPFQPKTRQLKYTKELDVPDIGFARGDIERRLAGLDWKLEQGLVTNTDYRIEHVYLVTRPREPMRR
jgi:hypothetical protein